MDSPAFYRAFKQYTDLFINYRVPTAANFLNRFRTGEMPVGVAGYDMYVLLSTTAPELNGRWGMAMLPGTLKEDGSIDRSANTSSSTANIILSDSAYQKEAWSFLQWWIRPTGRKHPRQGRTMEQRCLGGISTAPVDERGVGGHYRAMAL